MVHTNRAAHSLTDGQVCISLAFINTYCNGSWLNTNDTFRMNYFISTIREQYTYMLNSRDLATDINEFFDWALPLGGVLSTPFLGIMLDNISTLYILLILASLITVIGIAGSLPFLWAGYVNVIIFVFLRPLYYSAMS